MTVGASDQLRAAVATGALDTPYQMIPTPVGFDLRINVVDARWFGVIGAARRRGVVEHRVELDEARRKMTITDVHLDVEWDVGVDASGAGLPRLVGAAKVEKKMGRVWETSGNRTWGISQEGKPGLVVDFTFSSAEGHELIREPAVGLGWKEKAGTYEKIGIVAAIIGGSVAVAACVGVLVVFL